MPKPEPLPLLIDADFPGGNILVDQVIGDTVYLRQDQRDTQRFWFYWHFRVRGAAGQTLHILFTNGNVIGTRGPCISRDGGRTYQWNTTCSGSRTSFTYTFGPTEQETYFCFCLPYTGHHLQEWLQVYQGHPCLHVNTLCKTKQGRPVERLHLGKAGNRHKVVVTARHHACETSASYVLEGMMEAILADPWWQDQADVLVIPLVDKDGVENGDQGKGRNGCDHNRDYGRTNLYPETAALRTLLPEWGGGHPIDAVLDLHCPWIRDGRNESIHLVGARDDRLWQKQQQFAAHLADAVKGELVYDPADNLPFGQDWNVPASYEDGLSFIDWCWQKVDVALASTLEVPYANVKQFATTPQNLRVFGRELASALQAYLSEKPLSHRGTGDTEAVGV